MNANAISEEDSVSLENDSYDNPIMMAAAGAGTISLTTSKTAISQTAGATNSTISDTTNLTVTASGTSQYAIYVQETQNGGKLKNGSSELTQLTTERAYSAIDAGKWGYALAEGASVAASGLTYKAVPGNSTTAAFTGTTASSKPFTLAFAAKFADSNAAGHYTGNVIVSVAANPGEVTSGFGGVIYMQDLTNEACTNDVRSHAAGQLIDSRDDKIYWVAKLKDGNCWMTQNLDYNGGGTKISTPNGWTTSSSGAVTNTTAAYYDSGNTTYGNYYSYNAALKVCPSGWQLPTSNSTTVDGSFGKLTTAYGLSDAAGATTIQNAPLNFVLSGAVNYSLSGAGTLGYYWSSTAKDDAYAYYLRIFPSSNDLRPSDTLNRYVGASVRCLVLGS